MVLVAILVHMDLEATAHIMVQIIMQAREHKE
jgi:hypothetical protein